MAKKDTTKKMRKMSDSQLVEVLFGAIKYPIEFRVECETEIKFRKKGK